MQLKFLVDTQLRLAKYLSQIGFGAKHTINCPNGYLIKDQEILEIAKSEDRIVISKDADFQDNFLINGAPPKVLILKLGNCTNAELLNYFEGYIQEIQNALSNGASMIVLYPQEFRVYN